MPNFSLGSEEFGPCIKCHKFEGCHPRACVPNHIAWGALGNQAASLVISKSSRTTLKKGVISNGYSSTSMAIPLPGLSTEGTGKHTPHLVSPLKELYCILSQLLPEGPASNQLVYGC